MSALFSPPEIEILVVDKSSLPRDRLCAGVLTHKAFDLVQPLGPPDNIFEKPLHLPVKFLNWPSKTSILAEELTINLNRRAFDNWLVSILPPRIDLLANTTFKGFYRDDDEIKVVLRCDEHQPVEVKTRFLIGADGASSMIRKQLTSPLKTFITIQETIYPENIPDAFNVILEPSVTSLYSWLIPKGETAVLGTALIGRNKKHRDAKEKLNLLKRLLNQEQQGGETVEPPKGCLLARPERPRDIFLGRQNVLLAGEAAGLIDVCSGEGIYYALKSGLMAGIALHDKADVFAAYSMLCRPLIKIVRKKILFSRVCLNPLTRPLGFNLTHRFPLVRKKVVTTLFN